MAKLKRAGKISDLFCFRRTGNYYASFITGGAQTTQGLASANSLRAFPFYVPKLSKFDRIAIRVTTAGTGTTPRVRLGIYKDNSNIYPGSLVLDAGELDVSTTGVKETIINTALAEGLYWIVLVGQDTTSLAVAATPNTDHYPMVGYESDLSGTPLHAWAHVQTYGALPAAYPTSSPTGWTLHVPLIALRKAS
ncbi:MAG: hypothetical protein ACD_52C00048G0003 [uncultured bacterium]|uniref:Uncharacterized protein n=1 Tax=Candidatus Beckwithbacteria bacterium GW2011_GWB1_47_15 TaxID=1618371 RepID=A0A0G1RTD7_9BACT|nr:MAG: hypothetical protein ACD_52C00048G0003 [uncultured bacterium]KKT31453.1 MAG: hypothetical protein UW18_C0003G0037 [Microgenomates group bacterium GW2011_GWF1_44_10]KKU02422.1 MAG: hypothetical protein UX04_C0001G0193 [Microgenomates group bacterium GW2011_GWF2_45_18]KKU60584.1 MAG: hypothetical protein UX85_C0009G0037 [Candidatus Beckwithbacteria bacterium GW2011_GWB1_47_15]KKU71289.1 MAG: hypothetical protein UX97_C0009G0010 [Candidatus Beckwithbacteria bacterium GW2011_GWA2_47_25]HAU